jgi:hypothetical protein
MKKLEMNIKIDDLELSDEQKKMSPVKMSCTIISNVMYAYSSQVRGLSQSDRRKVYSISDKLEDAGKNTIESIELEDDEMAFIRTCFRESKLAPSDLLRRVEENVLAVMNK